MCVSRHAVSIGPHLDQPRSVCNFININHLTIGQRSAFWSVRGETPMKQTQSASLNPVQKSLLPMLHTWTRCISWTIMLSALLAVLFALVIDGCTRIRLAHGPTRAVGGGRSSAFGTPYS